MGFQVSPRPTWRAHIHAETVSTLLSLVLLHGDGSVPEAPLSVTPQSLARGIQRLPDEREISRRAQQHHLSGRVGYTMIFHEWAASITE